MKFLLHELASVAGGELYILQADGSLSKDIQQHLERDFSFSIDTRTLNPEEVFIALQGENSDGHAYLKQAIQKGSCGLIVSELDRLSNIDQIALCEGAPNNSKQHSVFVITVNDTLKALHALARTCRQKHPIPLIGITGSNGKTTVKDMTASILRVRYGEHVLQSEKSFNNHIGLPLTLANMQAHHRVGVLEMGMNAPGEIQYLAGIAKPDVGTVTNIAPAHIGFFDSLEAIMRAKMELIESLPVSGIVILNRDDALFERMFPYVNTRALVTFGIQQQPERPPSITARNIVATPDATYSFDLKTPKGEIAVSMNIPGYHNVSNALTATAICFALPVSEFSDDLKALRAGLQAFHPSPMRMQMMTHQNIRIINDAYNANPSSMASAFRTLDTLQCEGRKIAVLGDMFELGDHSQSAHYAVGRLAAEIAVDRLFLLGKYAQNMSQGAQDAGIQVNHIFIGDSHEQLANELANQIKEGDMLLCKASRGMTMEKVIEHLIDN